MTQPVPDLPISSARRPIWQRLSVVWLVPLAALAVTLWVAWQSYADQGPLIEIEFEQASGIHSGETELRYRDVTVGLVEDVGFSPTLDTVLVKVRLDKTVAGYADAGAAFWIVQPKVTAQGVSGLDTVLSGVFIEASWDTDPQGMVAKHKGTDAAPLLRPGEPGLKIRVIAGPGTQLVEGTPILHKGIAVGRVGKPVLSDDGSAVRAEAMILSPHSNLVSTTTRFWDTSGFTFSLGASGAEIDFSSLATLIAGGIAFDTVISGGTPAGEDEEFTLYVDETSARANLFQENRGPELNLTAVFDENFSGLSVGAPVFLDGVRIGEVANLNGIVDEERFGDTKVRLTTSMALRTSSFGLSEATTEAAMQFLDFRVSDGLRARLATASLLTGGLKVELVTVPDAPAAELNLDAEPFPIIPVAPALISDVSATAEGVMQRINNLPIEELLDAATQFLNSANVLASSEDIKSIPADVKSLVGDMRGLVGSEDIQALPLKATALLTDLQELSGELRAIAQGLESAKAVERMLAAVDAATEAARGVGSSVEGVPDLVTKLSAVASKAEALELQDLVTELSATIASVKTLLSQDGTQALPAKLGSALTELEGAITDLRAGGTVENLNEALASARNATSAIETASAGFPELLKRLNAVAANASETLSGLSEDSELNRSARSAMREVQDAARAIKQLARALERKPNSVILGR